MNEQQAAVVRAAKIISLVLSALLIVLGGILIFWSRELANTLRGLFGIVSLLFGGAKIFAYFSNDLYRIAFQNDLATGALVALFGLGLLVIPASLLPYLGTAVMLYVLIDGLLRVQTSVDAYRFGMPFWYVLLIGALLVFFAALAMFIFADNVHRLIWMGAVLMADGAQNFFVTMYTVRVRVRKRTPLPHPDDNHK